MFRGAALRVALLAALTVPGAGAAVAQKCTTQARMEASTRSGMADTALRLATAVKSDDMAGLTKEMSAAFASVPSNGRMESLIANASAKLAGDTLKVTQVYELDASMRSPRDASDVDFSCPLKDTVAETDFAISGLMPGLYGFAMVEAEGGEHPWLLTFLLQQEAGGWKLEAVYFHPRTAAGDNGQWYWNAARERVRAKQPWLAWMYYNEADELLRPASFVTSTELDKLRAEEHAAAPPALSDGIGVQTPLVVKGADGEEFHFTAMTSEEAAEGMSLHLVLHYSVQDAEDKGSADRARNVAAAKAMIGAHPELRQGYSGVVVFADAPQQAPSVVSVPMVEIP